jgi:uncharacterized protein YqgV (UPF0045/DUF77 family)
MQISAQISLYPLKQQRLLPTIEAAWKILEVHPLSLEKGTMSTVVSGEADKVFGSIQEVFLKAAESGPLSMVVTFSNACPI